MLAFTSRPFDALTCRELYELLVLRAEVFVVEGADYQCRIATHPARVVSLRAGGEDVLGPEGMAIGFEDAKGVRPHRQV